MILLFSVILSGETLCDEKMPIILERMDFPDPVIKIAIEPKSKVGTLLHHLHYHTTPLHPAHIACETGPSACIAGNRYTSTTLCTPIKYGADHTTPLQPSVTAMVLCGRHYPASDCQQCGCVVLCATPCPASRAAGGIPVETHLSKHIFRNTSFGNGDTRWYTQSSRLPQEGTCLCLSVGLHRSQDVIWGVCSKPSVDFSGWPPTRV
jgi:hypothetical protein